MEIDKNKLKETVTLSDVCDVAAAVVFVAVVVIVKDYCNYKKAKEEVKKPRRQFLIGMFVLTWNLFVFRQFLAFAFTV